MATILILTPALCTGCSAAQYARQADRSANFILEERVDNTLGDRAETVEWPTDKQPEPEQADSPDPSAEEQRTSEREVQVISLPEALEIAVRSNREYTRQKEDLFLAALSLAETRHLYSPLLNSTLSYLFDDGHGLERKSTTSFLAGVSQMLGTGGTLSLEGITSLADIQISGDEAITKMADTDHFNSSLSVRLIQPLLRGAGYEASHEELTIAERSMVYAIRTFELFREDFSIDVARRYYDLAQQYQSIENERRNLQDLTFAERQAKALFEVGRTRELDVLRARRNRLNAENRLLGALEGYESSTDRFRIFLGLPTEAEIDIVKGAPEFVLVDYDVDSAVSVALINRLDLINRREQLEDFERAVRLTSNGLLPQFDFDATLTLPAGPDSGFSNQEFSGESLSAGLSLILPVDRVTERSAHRRAQIRLVQARRDFDEFKDDLIVTVESAFRELERRKLSLEIQRQLIKDEQKNVRVARLRFERGEIPNRDVVEAQQSLLDARNSLIQEQVNYEIARLTLLRNIGIVFIDERGMWQE